MRSLGLINQGGTHFALCEQGFQADSVSHTPARSTGEPNLLVERSAIG